MQVTVIGPDIMEFENRVRPGVIKRQREEIHRPWAGRASAAERSGQVRMKGSGRGQDERLGCKVRHVGTCPGRGRCRQARNGPATKPPQSGADTKPSPSNQEPNGALGHQSPPSPFSFLMGGPAGLLTRPGSSALRATAHQKALNNGP